MNIIRNLQDALLTDTGVLQGFIVNLLSYSQIFTGVLVTIFIGYKVMLYFADLESKLDPFVLIRPILIMCALALYSQLLNLLITQPILLMDGAITESARATNNNVPTGISREDVKDWFANRATDLTVGVATSGLFTANLGIYDLLATNPLLELIHIVITFFANAAVFYILLRQTILLVIYKILGIFVLPFSLIPGNTSALSNWFFAILSIALWLPVLTILTTIIAAINPNQLDYTGLSPVWAIATQVALTLTILQVPKFASVLVSKGADAGSEVGSQALGNALEVVSQSYKVGKWGSGKK